MNVDPTLLKLTYGYAWPEKLAQMIEDQWVLLPWYKRVYWTLRGQRPKSYEAMVAEFRAAETQA